MDDNQVRKLMSECNLPDSCNNSELKETYIPWVILSRGINAAVINNLPVQQFKKLKLCLNYPM